MNIYTIRTFLFLVMLCSFGGCSNDEHDCLASFGPSGAGRSLFDIADEFRESAELHHYQKVAILWFHLRDRFIDDSIGNRWLPRTGSEWQTFRGYAAHRFFEGSPEYVEVFLVFPEFVKYLDWSAGSARFTGLGERLAARDDLPSPTGSSDLVSDLTAETHGTPLWQHYWSQLLLKEITGQHFESREDFESWRSRPNIELVWCMGLRRMLEFEPDKVLLNPIDGE